MNSKGVTVYNASLTFERAVAPIIQIESSFGIPVGCNLLIAPSGEGKTSLLRLLSGWFKPTDETASESDFSADYDPLRDVEFIGNHQTLLPWYTVRKNIVLRGGDLAKAYLNWQAVGLPDAAMSKYPYEMSLGMYKRAELVASLSRPIRLLLLDEFFSSLDLEARTRSLELIEAQVASAAVVLISTHTPEAFPHITSRFGFQHDHDRRIFGVRRLP